MLDAHSPGRSKNPLAEHDWLILGGCPRSGTTMLGLVLNAHPEIGLANELSIAQLLDRIGELFYRENSVRGVIDRKKGKKENWSRGDILAVTPTFDACAPAVFDAVFRGTFPDPDSKIRYFGDKLPKYYARDFDRVLAFLPAMRVIHVSRHPFDVVNSMLRRSKNAREGTDYWRPDQTIDQALLDWIDGWNFIVEQKKAAPDRYLHLKYEDAVFQPEVEFPRMAEFLGIANEFATDRIVTTDHHEREMLTESDEREIAARLGGLAGAWGSDPLSKLEQRYPHFQTAGLRARAQVAPPFVTRVQTKVERVVKAWRGE